VFLYRISLTAFADQIDGEGAKLYGGRWNQVGDSVLYTAETLSLAVLETIVHVDQRRKMERSLLVLSAPDDSCSETLTDLPADWHVYPYPAATANVGSQWIKEKRSLLLKVPSSVTAQLDQDLWQYNVLVNPNHPDFHKITVNRLIKWQPDKRLL
jgi:RES domain-containing protein